jgi:hypothetical protein
VDELKAFLDNADHLTPEADAALDDLRVRSGPLMTTTPTPPVP